MKTEMKFEITLYSDDENPLEYMKASVRMPGGIVREFSACRLSEDRGFTRTEDDILPTGEETMSFILTNPAKRGR